MRAVVATPVVDFPTQWAENAAEYLQKGAELVHDPFADHPLIRTAFAPHSTFALSDASFAELRVMADQLDVRVQIHLHETAAEIDISKRDHGKRPSARLEDAGLVNRSLLAVHGVHLDDAEIARFAEAGVGVMVSDVDDRGPAYAAGFELGDVVREIDGVPVETVAGLRRTIESAGVENLVEVAILRDGLAIDLEVRIADRPEDLPEDTPEPAPRDR